MSLAMEVFNRAPWSWTSLKKTITDDAILGGPFIPYFRLRDVLLDSRNLGQ